MRCSDPWCKYFQTRESEDDEYWKDEYIGYCTHPKFMDAPEAVGSSEDPNGFDTPDWCPIIRGRE